MARSKSFRSSGIEPGLGREFQELPGLRVIACGLQNKAVVTCRGRVFQFLRGQ